ncbi:MAG: isoprenylcysteine carboxylmethyltransferase family protein [Parafilimonas sp.]
MRVNKKTAFILGLFVWLVAVPFVHGVVPWLISLRWGGCGWAENQPKFWNLLGLLPVLIASGCLIWVMILGFANIPEQAKLEWNASFLITKGPYAFSRNPMYLGELGLWFGWSVFYGSAAIFIVFILLCVIVNYVILPREEHLLEKRFGEVYLLYKNTVPRWLGKFWNN